jgi:2-oxoglutarate ferredoxin oxidoreductase subunit gamma
MQESFLFSGFGGQGVMFVGQLLAYAAMDAGLEVTWIPSYGPEMRGGTAHCTVIIGDKPVGSPVVARPDTVIAFNKPSFEKYDALVAPGGLLVANGSLIPDGNTDRTDMTLLQVPATDIAYEMGNARLANVVLLGATLKARPVLTLEDLSAALDAHIPAHRRNMLDVNLLALQRGASFAQELVAI